MTHVDTEPYWLRLTHATAEAYEHYLVPLLFTPGARRLTPLAALAPGECVLDVACATGSVARYAASSTRTVGRIVGLDLNANMLKVAGTIWQGRVPAIEWQQGDVYHLPFAEATFDVLFCHQALQFFSRRLAALCEMHRVLVLNGRVILSVLRSMEHNPGWAILTEVLEIHLGAEAARLMSTRFATLNMDQLRDLVASAGFRDIHILLGIEPLRYPSVQDFFDSEIKSWLLAEPLIHLNRAACDALIRDLTLALHLYTDDEGIIFPTETYLAVARR
jgi:ubiquinone/menaquinone biosynthesis C-methylase UbiE